MRPMQEIPSLPLKYNWSFSPNWNLKVNGCIVRNGACWKWRWRSLDRYVLYRIWLGNMLLKFSFGPGNQGWRFCSGVERFSADRRLCFFLKNVKTNESFMGITIDVRAKMAFVVLVKLQVIVWKSHGFALGTLSYFLCCPSTSMSTFLWAPWICHNISYAPTKCLKFPQVM